MICGALAAESTRVAEELKFESDVMAPFCDELVWLAEDSDFADIQNLQLELDSKIMLI